MSLNGTTLTTAALRVGDVLEVGSQVSFVCIARPFQLSQRVRDLHPFGEPDLDGMVGESPSMWQLREELRFVAMRAGHVLIQGSTGSGKELAARAVHRISSRTGALVARNAATIPESLLDSELFGNAKNYPNVGSPERKGLVGAADAGTLFLDEFGELPHGHQTHLLRVLDAGEYQRLGDSGSRRADFCLIAATNRSDEALREDVLARFAFRIRLPALSARVEDVPLLMRHQLLLMTADDLELQRRFITPDGQPRFSASFVRAAIRAADRMNLRELRNRLWTSLQHARSDVLDWIEPRVDSAPERQSADETRLRIQVALDENQGSVEKTWRALGLANRFVLIRLMKKHDIQVERRVTGEPAAATRAQ
jgi:DNA-binding NtrC family response regulator